MKAVGVIPARMGSSRFPGKPLAPILGLPMVEHVRRRVSMCSVLDAVYVATCDKEIAEAVEGYGGKAIMTSSEHPRATDRVAEVARSIEAELYVMVQGDEPMTTPRMVWRAVADMVERGGVPCVNLAKRIETDAERQNPNTIKVPTDHDDNALYFSRHPIPAELKQVCVIPFKREALMQYAMWRETPLEQAESVDMLRFLEHGWKVRMVPTTFDTQSVDTPEELRQVEALMREDALTRAYLFGSKVA